MSIVEMIHASAYAEHIRESQYIYPLLQCVHITGIGMFAGGLSLINLRLAGVGGQVGLAEFARHAMRIAWIGLALIVVTGINMAASFMQVFAVSAVLQTKLAVILFAIANAVIVQRGIAGGAGARWVLNPPPSEKTRKWAVAGIAVLVVIITLGKLLAYIGGKD